jgi:hypothetical protein
VLLEYAAGARSITAPEPPVGVLRNANATRREVGFVFGSAGGAKDLPGTTTSASAPL